MKKTIFAGLMIAALAAVNFAQSKDEQEILKIHRSLEDAYVARQIAPFEAALAKNYTFSGPTGQVQTRDEMLSEMRAEIAKPTFKNISETFENLKVSVLGNTGLVTAGWTSVSQSLAPGSAPHTDKGQYTAIYEKAGGKWMIVREVFTEAQHDRKTMEEEVLKASNAYDAAMLSGDKDAYARLLATDYTYTTENGYLVTRDEEIAHFAQMKITSAESRDKKIRIISNTTAVETGIYHAVGTSNGKPFDETGRYTTTWIWRDLRWQIIADHNSIIRK